MRDNLPALAIVAACLLACSVVGTCVHDYWTSKPEAAEVTIVDKTFVPGHYETTCSTDDKGHTVCNADWVPPKWTVQYEDVADRFTVSVSSGTYEALRLGDRKWIRYSKGGGYWSARYGTEFLPAKPNAETWR